MASLISQEDLAAARASGVRARSLQLPASTLARISQVLGPSVREVYAERATAREGPADAA